METRLPPDFKEFLRLLASAPIEYLLVGGYAVAYHGYPRPTGDLNIWIAVDTASAEKLAALLGDFGFAGPDVTTQLFLTPGRVVRMGVPPVRIEVLTSISGVDFSDCYSRAVRTTIDGVEVAVISARDLIANKAAAGRDKDLNDLKHLRKALGM